MKRAYEKTHYDRDKIQLPKKFHLCSFYHCFILERMVCYVSYLPDISYNRQQAKKQNTQQEREDEDRWQYRKQLSN